MQNAGGAGAGVREGGKEQQAAEVPPELRKRRRAHDPQRHREVLSAGGARGPADHRHHQPGAPEDRRD